MNKSSLNILLLFSCFPIILLIAHLIGSSDLLVFGFSDNAVESSKLADIGMLAAATLIGIVSGHAYTELGN